MRFRTWNRHHRLAAWLVAGSLILAPAALAAEKPADKPAMDPEMAKQMEAWAKIAAPGTQHAEMVKSVGKWKTTIKSWMAPGEPTVTEGSSTCTALLGGRFLQEEFKGTFGEGPFEGFGLTGYDNQHQEYVGTWMDSMGTGIMMTRGKMDPTGKILTMTAEYDDPITGKKVPMRMVTRHVDADTRVFEMYGMQEGKEVKQMEITYKRAK
jgi:hypothetical protein